MLYQTIWYSICLLICFSGLFDLFKSKNEVFLKGDFSPLTNDSVIKLSVCFKLDSSLYNCSNLKETSLTACKNLKNYLDYVGDRKRKSPQTIIQKFGEFEIPPLFGFANAVEEYKYLNIASLCTLYRLNIVVRKAQTRPLVFEVANHFNITAYFFIHGKLMLRYQRFEHLLCDNFRSCRYFTWTTRQFGRALLPAPYSTNCLNYSETSYPFRRFEKIDSKSACIQECLKSKHRLPEFFYTESDSDLLEFNTSGNYALLEPKDVEHCGEPCKRDACEYSSFIYMELDYRAQNHVKIQIETGQSIFEAIPFMDSRDFWLKFLGFITLFFKVSLLSLVLKANEILRRKLSVGFAEKNLIISIVSVLLWLCLICSLFYGSFLARTTIQQYNDKNLTSFFDGSLPFVPINFSIALCKKLDTNIANLSVWDLAKPAKAFNTTKSFVLTFGKEQPERLNFLNDRFFYKSTNRSHLEHCFSTDVYIREQRYKSLLSLSTLNVRTNVSFDSILLEQINRSFTSKSFKLTRNLEFLALEQNSENNCEDYRLWRNRTSDEQWCDSKQSCLERCFNAKFLDKYRKLPSSDTLVHSNNYEEHQKHSLYFDYEHPNEPALMKECEKKFEKQDCKSTQFLSYERADFHSNNEVQINPFFFQVKQYNILHFNRFQLVCNLLGLSTILVALNWPKLSNTTIKLINYLLKTEDALDLRNLFFFVSFAGFTAHAIYIFRETCLTDVQLISTNYYFDFLNPNLDIPDFVFCLDTLAKFEKNEVINGELLAKKTAWLNESYLFEQIFYYNLDMKRQVWKPNSALLDNVKISPWFMLNLKCFTISYRLNHRHPLNYVINSLIHFKFNSKMAQHTAYLFTSKKKNTTDLSKYFLVNFTSVSRVHYTFFETSYNNQYQTLINPKLWFTRGYPINVSILA